MSDDSRSGAWEPLEHHRDQFGSRTLNDLFTDDPGRFSRFSVDAAGLFLDYSKNRITDQTLGHLFSLARERQLEDWIRRMFAGDRINVTEDRAVLHVALRNRSGEPVMLDQRDVMTDVRGVLDRIRAFVSSVHSGEWRGATGRKITDVVNIGIGGSDLGPHMAVEALRDFHVRDMDFHFVSNVDGADMASTLEKVDAETTLFIVASKTFTTQETMINARSARRWFQNRFANPADVARHFVAVSTNREEVEAFGIDPANMFEFWEWVGGRFSMWSAIGLSIALAVGMEQFESMLVGAHAMDRHFRTAPLEQNMPVILALIGVWNRNFLGMGSLAVLPYDQRLHLLPAYLQQCEMESNGKSTGRDGRPVPHPTCPILWGEPGTNGQHAFYQLLHQGTDSVAVDFIVALSGGRGVDLHHRILVANCIAQSEALMRGRTTRQAMSEMPVSAENREQLARHRTFAGNRSSNMLVLDELTPSTLGALVALYEHKVFVQGIIWGINSFDQWGVELGKQLANDLLDELDTGLRPERHDSSTNGLMQRFGNTVE